MDFFIDENLPMSLKQAIENQEFKAGHVREEGLKGTDDKEVASYAKEKDAILITKDKEFASPLHYPPETHKGVIVIRIPNNKGLKIIRNRLEEFLGQKKLEQIKDNVFILEQDRYRERDKT